MGQSGDTRRDNKQSGEASAALSALQRLLTSSAQLLAINIDQTTGLERVITQPDVLLSSPPRCVLPG